jgi:hypothetical protein
MKFFKIELPEKRMTVEFILPENKLEASSGYIEFFFKKTILAQVLGIKMIGCKKVEEMNQNSGYDIIFEEGSKVKIKGNLYNAFAMLDYRGILPYESTKSLKQQAGFNESLDLTKLIIFENTQSIDGSIFGVT